MRPRKIMRERGKIRLSRFFQEFTDGDKVAVVMEHSKEPKFPRQIQGRTGIIAGKRGSAYLVKMNDLNKEKTYVIHPIHLKKLKSN